MFEKIVFNIEKIVSIVKNSIWYCLEKDYCLEIKVSSILKIAFKIIFLISKTVLRK